MAATAGIAIPIYAYRVQDTQGAQAAVRRYPEKSGQNNPGSTYLYIGTPVQLDVAGATGFVIACPTMNSAATAIIAGFSLEFGHNLTTSGIAKQMGTLTGAVQNQSSAVIIFGGAWPSDGNMGISIANDITEFIGILGNSSSNASATIAQAQLGTLMGLTQDATTKYWYVDNNITTTAGGACVEITTLVSPIGTLNGFVGFRVTKAAQQMRQ